MLLTREKHVDVKSKYVNLSTIFSQKLEKTVVQLREQKTYVERLKSSDVTATSGVLEQEQLVERQLQSRQV